MYAPHRFAVHAKGSGKHAILSGPGGDAVPHLNSFLNEALQDSLRFEYQSGNVTPLRRPHSTGWRTLPGLMCSQAHAGREVMYLPGGAKWLARTGEMIVLAAGTLHRVDVVTPRETRRWCHVNYFLLNSLDLFSLLEVRTVIPRRSGIRLADRIEEWVAENARLAEGEELLRHARRNAFGFELLGMLVPFCRLREGALEQYRRRRDLWPVIERMHAEFARPLDRDTLAEMAHLSRAQFHCVFKAFTGATPVEYLRRIRLRHAQQLLITTSESVKEIALRCGCPDPLVFSKLFRRECGVSPREYRRRTAELRTDGMP
jgi:AraC-like DNA-binding protein